ncbi:hypothetical protein CCUS01_02730 [Colletotrichum cuscutae]|uniref:Uncharacterized protein n=1 Tax=Colletotrichum cuscutae TaxID=1209917 RepID=A0AAJ0DPC7_9PEZI|nr:hypothetical protein CCUS01_02730 [Colletotrichum cuscutae]
MRDDSKDDKYKAEKAQRPSHLTWLTTPIRITRQLSKALRRCSSWLPHAWAQKLLTWKQWVRNSPSKYQADPAATWVRFFGNIGLEYLDNPIYKDHLQSVTANYLPDNLIVAPAYGQVGAIIAAAAATGAHIKMTGDNWLYPVIFGRQFQFNFRQHTTLGTIGAYSQYITQGGSETHALRVQQSGLRTINSEVLPPPGKLSLPMKHCRGGIGLAKGILLSSKKMPRTSLNLYKETHRFELMKRLGDRNRDGDHVAPSLNVPDDVNAYCPIIIFFSRCHTDVRSHALPSVNSGI